MKFSAIFAAAMATVASASRVQDAFEAWTQQNNISYSSPMERERRFAVFARNFELVELKNNSGYSGATENAEPLTFGLTKFADMTPEEFASTLTYKSTRPATPLKPEINLGDRPQKYIEEECSFAVRDQGSCGSCWAFSTVAAVESINCRLTGKKVDLSEQELVDCDTNQEGCNGAYDLFEPMDWVGKNSGISSSNEYAYTARAGTCQGSSFAHHADVIDHSVELKSAEELIDEIIKHGAASVAVDATSFQFYMGGDFTPSNCINNGINHAVTATGYEVRDGEAFFHIKNSWGARWGKQGYVSVQYGACGLGEHLVGAVAKENVKSFLQ